MFGGGGGMFNDPFFGSMEQQVNSQMRQMDALMGGMMGQMGGLGDPFGRGMFPAVEGGRRRQEPGGGAALPPAVPADPFGGMMQPFGLAGGGGLFGNMFGQMEALRQQALNDPRSHVYSHSTVVAMDNGGGGGQGESAPPPRYYESTRQVRKVGDAAETRHTVRDSTTGEERMSIGHHLDGGRAHVVTKRRCHGGPVESEQRLHNVREDDARHFDTEFTGRLRRNWCGGAGGSVQDSSRARRAAAIEDMPSGSGPVVEEPDDDEPPQPDDGSKRRRRRMFNL